VAVGSQLAFLVFAAVTIYAAWRVVAANDVMRAALALVVVLGSMAPLFILLAAEFVAVVQVLVYVGAVIILFLFGVMLTRSPTGNSSPTGHAFNHSRRWPAGVLASLLFLTLWFSIRDAFGDEEVAPDTVGTTRVVGQSLLTDHVIAFEAISVLLLAALVGAIVLARREP
jgi:NADH-quinone oxidoreductase subunit J